MLDEMTSTDVSQETEEDRGTASGEMSPAPDISATKTDTRLLTEDIGFGRSRVRMLHKDYDDLHHRSYFVEWQTRTRDCARSSVATLLEQIGSLGFAWRDVARLIGVSVPAIQKWRRGEGTSGENRARVASLVAACDLIAEHYLVEDLGTWFEVPLVVGVPLTPLDLYAAERLDLVFDHASGHTDPEEILTAFEPEWRERYRTTFEVFRAADGELAIRPKDSS